MLYGRTPARVDGKRTRSIDWARVHSITGWRRQARNMARDGFTQVCGFSNHKWDSPDISHRIVDVRIGLNGESLWVKLEPRL